MEWESVDLDEYINNNLNRVKPETTIQDQGNQPINEDEGVYAYFSRDDDHYLVYILKVPETLAKEHNMLGKRSEAL
jgi:hypothetical protein